MAGVPTLIAEPGTGFELTVVDLDPLRAAICVVGELDLAARDELSAVLQQLQDSGRRIVRLDLSAAAFLDCSCLGVLVAAHRRFLDLHGLLVLSGVTGIVARVLEITGLDETLFIVPGDQDPFGNAQIARARRLRGVPGQRETVTRHGRATR